MSYNPEAEQLLDQYGKYPGLSPLLNLFHRFRDRRFLRQRGSSLLASVDPSLVSEEDQEMSLFLISEGTEGLLSLNFLTASPETILRVGTSNEGDQGYMNLLSLRLGWMWDRDLSQKYRSAVLVFKNKETIDPRAQDNPTHQKLVSEVLREYDSLLRQNLRFGPPVPRVLVERGFRLREIEVANGTWINPALCSPQGFGRTYRVTSY